MACIVFLQFDNGIKFEVNAILSLVVERMLENVYYIGQELVWVCLQCTVLCRTAPYCTATKFSIIATDKHGIQIELAHGLTCRQVGR